MALDTTPFDPAEYLSDKEALAAYLTDAFETGDAAFICDALGVVARAAGISQIARNSDLSRESLYRALSSEGNPEFSTVLKVLAALDLKLQVVPSLS